MRLYLLGFLLCTQPVNARDTVQWEEIRDLDFGHTLYEFFQQNYFSSIVYLTASQKSGKLRKHQDQAELLLGGLYLSYGLHDEAGQIFQKLIDKQTSPRVRDRAWYYLARIRYLRGSIEDARAAIERVGNTLPADLQQEKRLLFANILLAQHKHDEVRQLLANEKDKNAIWLAYARYNLGIALLNQGNRDAGRALLEEVGKFPASEEESYSLRDKANLSLGYSYIQENKSEPAVVHLRRVRLDGPMTNKALLGLGWAYTLKDQHKESLAPWLELRKRDILDPAVQESLIASAYAYNKLKAYGQSLEYYQNAITIYESEITRLEQGIQSIQQGDMLRAILKQDPNNQMGWFWEMEKIPDLPESRYLLHLYASQHFQETLKSYRDLVQLQRNLGYWVDNIDVFEDMLETRRIAYQDRLPRIRKNREIIQADAYRKQADALKTEITRIETGNDVFALANARELRLVKILNRVKQQLDTLPNHPRVEPARDKYRLLRGTLYWNIASQSVPRTWKLKRSVQALDEALNENKQRAISMLEAQKRAPLYFENYRDRIDTLKAQVNALQKQILAQTSQVQTYLEQLAVTELRQQQQRLATYLTQAQFAVAQIQDRGAQQEKGDKP